MAVENLPLWTALPNWRETISETAGWVSAVLASPTGAEQRFSLRETPRRTFEASFTLTGQDRTWADNAFVSALATRWYVPIFNDTGRITVATVFGNDEIMLDTTGREFREGGFVMLRQDVFTATVHEITQVLSDRLVVTPTVANWPAGTLAYPCAVMRLDGDAAMQRRADRAGEFRLRFVQDGGAFFDETIPPTFYLGYPVLTTAPNESSDLSTTYSRILAEISNPVTRKFVVDTAGKNFSVQQHAWLVRGRAEQDALRGFFYFLRGRRNAAWIPTFAADFDLASSALSSATQIIVKQSGYTRFGGPRFGRQDIRIELRDGTTLYRRVTGSTDLGSTERLTFSSNLGVAIAPSDVKRISFMHLCRLDQDTVEFVHHTDKQGALTVRAGFKTCGDLRLAPLVSPLPFAQGIPTPEFCGEPPLPPEPVELGDFWLYGDWEFPQNQASQGAIGFNAYTIDEANSSNLVGNPGTTVTFVTAPVGANELRVSARLAIRQLNGGKAGEYVGRIERRYSEDDPWEELTSESVFLDRCTSTSCGPYAIEIPELTTAVLPGWQYRLRLIRPSFAQTVYNNDSNMTYIEGTWTGEAP